MSWSRCSSAMLFVAAMGFGQQAASQSWLNDDMPKLREFSVGVGAQSSSFGHICRESGGVKFASYYFRTRGDNTCGKDTRVRIRIDNKSQDYDFDCDENGGQISLTRRADSRQAMDDIANISDRLQKAKEKKMFITSPTIKGEVEFSLIGAKKGIDRIISMCKQT